MQIIKKRLKKNNKNVNIKFNIYNNNVSSGVEENLDNFISETKVESINIPTNDDIIRIKNKIYTEYSFKYYTSGNTETPIFPGYYNSLFFLDFSVNDINIKKPKVFRSFYMVELFDSPNINKQNKLYVGYLPLNLLSTYELETHYTTISNFEFSSLYISDYNLEKLTDGDNNVDLYLRFTFYDGTIGKFHVFYNKANENEIGDLKNYFKINVNKTNKNYSFEDGDVDAYEIVDDTYINIFNNTINSFNNLKPNYPSDFYFNNKGGYDK